MSRIFEKSFFFFLLLPLIVKVDGHFGRGKMALRKEAGGRPIQSTGEIVAAFAQVSNTAECISVVKSEYEINPMKRKIRKWV